jgi:hypothetical protein
MAREELEHIIRASGQVTDQYEFVIVGSQSILGPVPRPQDAFTVSMEADIYPLQAPELADKIDGAIGEGSQFHQTFGYYAQGVGPDTAILPADWMQRVHRIQNSNTHDRVGYCLGERRTAPFAWPCSCTATSPLHVCWRLSRPCPSTPSNSAGCAQRSAAGRKPLAMPGMTSPKAERG